MRNIIAIAKKELTVYLTTPWAWIVFTVVSFVSSLFFIAYLIQFKDAHEQIRTMDGGWEQIGPDAQYLRNLTDGVVMPLFSTMLVVLLFVVPFLSARIFAEERRQKTLELLMTAPLTSFEIVLGKYLGGLCIVIATISTTLVYPVLLTAFGSSFSATTAEKTMTLEWPVVLLGFLALVLWGAAIHSIGTFISSLTESVIIAGLVTLCVSLVWLVIKLAAPNAAGILRDVLDYVSFEYQLRNLLRGVLDLQPLVFFASLILVFLLATHRAVESRRWV
ncbi:MAG: ABC transporter permease subunit [Archangiaceae bacterium]|nr:ABC transporter permease subunit [Archangiaceae bacterium]